MFHKIMIMYNMGQKRIRDFTQNYKTFISRFTKIVMPYQNDFGMDNASLIPTSTWLTTR